MEGNTGTATATFTITLSNPSAFTTSFHWATGDGTARSGADYQAGGTNLVIRHFTSPMLEDRAVLEFDVTPVVAGLLSSVTFGFEVSFFTSSTGPVLVAGCGGDGVPYTPASLYHDTDTFTSLASDGTNTSSAATVTLGASSPAAGGAGGPRREAPWLAEPVVRGREGRVSLSPARSG